MPAEGLVAPLDGVHALHRSQGPGPVVSWFDAGSKQSPENKNAVLKNDTLIGKNHIWIWGENESQKGLLSIDHQLGVIVGSGGCQRVAGPCAPQGGSRGRRRTGGRGRGGRPGARGCPRRAQTCGPGGKGDLIPVPHTGTPRYTCGLVGQMFHGLGRCTSM